ncbi:hypothetical protein KC367_g10 [Hortaea werneckii]|nr:hypothetical protein KC367_g10 [Hortaea werneckii]
MAHERQPSHGLRSNLSKRKNVHSGSSNSPSPHERNPGQPQQEIRDKSTPGDDIRRVMKTIIEHNRNATKPGGARTRTAIRYSTASCSRKKSNLTSSIRRSKRKTNGRATNERAKMRVKATAMAKSSGGEEGPRTRFRRLACLDDEAGG